MVYLKAIIAFFVIIDPIGNIPLFLAVTKTLEKSPRKRALNIAVIVAFLILLLFSFTGQFILNEVFQIKIADLRIAGGIFLFLIAIKDMQNNGHASSKSKNAHLSPDEIGCVPMACPLLAGPGAMVTSLTIWNDPQAGPMVTIVAIATVLSIFWILMRIVDVINTPFGQVIITAVSKIMLILLAAIGVNMIVQGITYYLTAGN
jgi:multiple antibiotic resistance protein